MTDPDVPDLYDCTVRIVCEAESHPKAVLALYRHFVGDGRPLADGAERWHWFQEVAFGGGPIVPVSGQRATRHKRKATAEEKANGWQWDFVESDFKRLVDDGENAHTWECPRCGLRRLVNRKKVQDMLDNCMSVGVSAVRLQDVVARLS